MQIYDKEVDFRISRLKDAGKLEMAVKKIEATEKKIVKNKTNLMATLRDTNEMLRQFFVDATGEDVLADCDDLEESKKAYYGFLRDVKEQSNKIIRFSADDIE